MKLEPDDILGKKFPKNDVPNYPGRIYADKHGDSWQFYDSSPRASVQILEVRFREVHDGFIVYEARWADFSNLENPFGDWENEYNE